MAQGLNGNISRVLLPVALAMSVGAIVWGATVAEQVRQMTAWQQSQDAKIDRMDNSGTRALVLVDDRQKSVIHRLDILEQRMERIERHQTFPQQ